MSTRPSTTLADLFTLLFAANPFSAARASLWRWSSDEFEDGLAHGGQCRSRRRPVDSFFPPCCFKPAILEESVGDHRHERMTVKALPGSALEVIETKFFFQLLVSLLANPSRLDGGRYGAQVSLRRQVGKIVFLLSRHPVLANQPSLVAGQMLLTLVPDPLRRSVGNPHADRSKTSLELSFRASAPTDGAPFGVGQHVFGRYR